MHDNYNETINRNIDVNDKMKTLLMDKRMITILTFIYSRFSIFMFNNYSPKEEYVNSVNTEPKFCIDSELITEIVLL